MTAATIPDRVLVERTIVGDRDAFGDLVRRYQDPLYRYGRTLGLDHDTALDLVQDACVKAFGRLAQCHDPERVRAWFFRIFRNTVLDWAKNIRRTEIRLLEVDEPPDLYDLAEQQALRATLGVALASLPAILREAFLLHHHLGHSHEEIAETAGVTVSAVKMRVMRARDLLRRRLEPELDEVTRGASRSSQG